MSKFIITYDLRKGRDYKAVDQAIEAKGGVRLAQSVWGIELSWKTKKVLAWVKKLLNDNDTFIVLWIPQPSSCGSHNASKEAKTWMENHFSPTFEV